MSVTDSCGPSGQSLPFEPLQLPPVLLWPCEGEGRGRRDAVCVVGSCLPVITARIPDHFERSVSFLSLCQESNSCTRPTDER